MSSTGPFEVIADLKPVQAAVNAAIVRNLIAGVLIILLVSFLTFYMIKKLAILPVRAIRKLLGMVAEGDLTVKAAHKSEDDIGKTVASLNDMTEKLKNLIVDISKGTHMLSSSSAKLTTISRQMTQNAEQTTGRAHNVAVSAEEMSANMASVVSASEQASGNIGSVGGGNRRDDRHRGRNCQKRRKSQARYRRCGHARRRGCGTRLTIWGRQRRTSAKSPRRSPPYRPRPISWL